MTGKGDMRPIRATPGKQIIHLRRTVAKWQARTGKAKSDKFTLKQIEGAPLNRCY
jgi:hypothetical protein